MSHIDLAKIETTSVQNHLGQPIGLALLDWKPPSRPDHVPMTGRFCRLEPLDPAKHGADLYAANQLDAQQQMWTYLPYGPFSTYEEYLEWLNGAWQSTDPLFFAIIDLPSGLAVGIAGYLRIDLANGSIEVGHLAYSPRLQHTPAATESMFLLMKNAFELGFRRYEWKCDSLNHPSRNAAERLGFTREGLFRQAVVYKQRTRDTCWFSIIDREWPALHTAFLKWLAPENFDAAGRQKCRLSELTAKIRG